MKTLVLLLTMVLFSVPAFAETYVWEDDQGTVNFAEDLGKVPKKYRNKVRVVGEEEPPPAEAKEGKEQPAAQQKTGSSGGEAVQQSKESAPAAKQDKKTVYGGKDADAWKAEFAALNADLKAAEKQLVENRNRLKDTSSMSRSQYLGIQQIIKSIEHSVLERRKKLDDLKKEAGAAGVPAELME